MADLIDMTKQDLYKSRQRNRIARRNILTKEGKLHLIDGVKIVDHTGNTSDLTCPYSNDDIAKLVSTVTQPTQIPNKLSSSYINIPVKDTNSVSINDLDIHPVPLHRVLFYVICGLLIGLSIGMLS